MWNVSGFRHWALAMGLLWSLVGPAFLQAEPIDDYNTSLKFYEQKRWDFAARGFEAFVKLAPEHPKAALAQLYQGQALTHSQKYAEARTVFREFLKTHGDHPDAALAAYRVGESSYFLDDFPAAVTELQEFVTKYPEHDLTIWGWQYLGEAQLQTGNATEAVKSFETVLRGKADVAEQVEAKFHLARAYELLKEPTKSIAIYRELAAGNHPRAAEALFSLASIDYQANQFVQAGNGFEQVIARFPKHGLVPTADLNAGYAFYQADDFAKAEGHFAAAAKTPALANSASFWVGMCRKGQKNWIGAIEIFTDLAAKIPSGELAEKVTYHWADCEARRDRYAEARRIYESIAVKWPTSTLADDAQYSAADCALRAGEVADGITLSQSFATKFPTSPLKQLNDIVQGRALLARGDEAAKADALNAQEDYRQAAALFRSVASSSQVQRTAQRARIQLALAEKRLKNYQAVIDALNPIATSIEKGEAGASDMVDVLPILGEALLKSGQPGEAEAVLQRALQLLPATADHRQTLMMLAEVRATQSRWAEMFESLDQLQAADKNGALAAESAYRNAEYAMAAKSWDNATKLLTRVVDQGETSDYYAAALTELGKVQAEQQQFSAAAGSYEKLLASNVVDTEVLATAAFNRGVCLEKDAGDDPQKLGTAAEALEQGVKRFAIPQDKALPDDTERRTAHYVIRSARLAATIRAKLKQSEAADQLWQTANEQIGKLPPDEQALEKPDVMLYEWAAQLFNAGNAKRADELFTRLYQTYPASEFADDAKLYVAQGFDEEGHPDSARALYKSLQDDIGASAETKRQALANWLSLEARVENWAESGRLASLVIQNDPASPDVLNARYRLAESLLHLKQLEPALKVLTELRVDPAVANVEWRPQLELLWAETKFQEKDYESVRSAMAALIESQPAAELVDQAHMLLGKADKNEALFPEARVHLELVVKSAASAKSPLAATARTYIADTYLTELKFDEALSVYTDVYANYPFPEFQSQALLQIAKIDMAQKRWDQAKNSLETLIQEFPNSPDVKTAREQLLKVQENLPAKQ